MLIFKDDATGFVDVDTKARVRTEDIDNRRVRLVKGSGEFVVRVITDMQGDGRTKYAALRAYDMEFAFHFEPGTKVWLKEQGESC